MKKIKSLSKKRKIIGGNPKELINSLSNNGLPLTEEASMKIKCSTIDECNDRMSGIREAIQHILVMMKSDRKTKKKINIPLYFGEKINDTFTGINSLRNSVHKKKLSKPKHLSFNALQHLGSKEFSNKIKKFANKLHNKP